MKNLILLFVSVLLTVSVFAQQSHQIHMNNPKAQPVHSMPNIHQHGNANHDNDRAQQSFYLDYDLTDQNTFGTVPSGYVIPTNSHFQCSDTFSFTYVGMSFDTLIDANSLTPYLYP